MVGEQKGSFQENWSQPGKAVHAGNGEAVAKEFILNAPGGYGKTFVFQVIASKIRSEGGIVLCVASTGLAAQNLEGGRTAHSRFKIPIDILEDSVCNIKAQVIWQS